MYLLLLLQTDLVVDVIDAVGLWRKQGPELAVGEVTVHARGVHLVCSEVGLKNRWLEWRLSAPRYISIKIIPREAFGVVPSEITND